MSFVDRLIDILRLVVEMVPIVVKVPLWESSSMRLSGQPASEGGLQGIEVDELEEGRAMQQNNIVVAVQTPSMDNL